MKIKEYLKELSIVVLGIIIAFWLNNIGLSNNNKKMQEQALRTIQHEVKENIKKIKPIRQSMVSLDSSFREILNSDKRMDMHYDGFEGVNNGYETAKYTGVLNGIDYKIIESIVSVYKFQEGLEISCSKFQDELISLAKIEVDNKYIKYMMLYTSNINNNLNEYENICNKLITDLEKFIEEEY